jgi:hypothetical protein
MFSVNATPQMTKELNAINATLQTTKELNNANDATT